MSSTLETINLKFLRKFSMANSLIDHCRGSVRDYLRENLRELIDDYEISTAEVVSQYFITAEVNTYISYLRLILNMGILQRLGEIITIIRKVASDCKSPNKDFTRALEQYTELVVDIPNLANNSYYCDSCRIPLTIDTEHSTFFCRKCGKAENVSGMIFDEGERESTSANGYDPVGRFKFLIDRIQAKESIEIPPEVIDGLNKCAKKYSIRGDEMVCDDVRLFLQEIKQSKYNDHVPHIRKLLTGIAPPELSPEEVKEIQTKFYAVVRIYEIIKPAERKNCPCHRYFLFKVIEDVLLDHPDKNRTQAILGCIHLQSAITLVKNDNFWKKICEHHRAITYRPTIKYKRKI
jgi:hypothetical protein